MRRGDRRHGSGVPSVRGSDRWAAAGGGRDGGGRHARPAVTRGPKEGHKGGTVVWVVMVCAAALLGIWLIIGSVALYVPNRALAAHGVRTQGQVVEAYADPSDEVVYTVDGTDHEVPEPALCERCPTRNGPSRIRWLMVTGSRRARPGRAPIKRRSSGV